MSPLTTTYGRGAVLPGYAELAEAGEQLRIARLVLEELGRPDREVEPSVLALAAAELRRARRAYADRRAALGL
jgi:hypothetical protein